MKDMLTIVLTDEVIAKTPRAWGVNVEMQDDIHASNLLDWVADSGVGVVRTFHPEQTLLKPSAKSGEFDDIASASEFETWRQSVVADPGAGIHWDAFRFAENVPWMGVPDDFVKAYLGLGVEPLVSLGYGTALYEKPLIKDVNARAVPGDEGIDWAAAASAYAYYFAVMYRYAGMGATRFMMVNEPENRRDWFHLPEDLEDASWVDLFWSKDEEQLNCYGDILAAQYAVMARLARSAMEDVRGLINDENVAAGLQLTGPATVYWRPLWRAAAEYLDALDFHHYHGDSTTFDGVYTAASAEADRAGKKMAISEFNRFSGGIPIGRMLFDLDESLDTAKLIMQVLAMASPTGPEFDFATFYLFAFPSTHRNYKHLLYGDMNCVDWTGRDQPLWHRGSEIKGEAPDDSPWYPSFAEQQIRHATAAYHMFRMLTRCVPGEVVRCGRFNPSTSGPNELQSDLQVLAVRQADRVLVNVLNPSDQTCDDLRIEHADATRAIVRVTDGKHADHVVTAMDLKDGAARLAMPAKSLMQVELRFDVKPEPEQLAIVHVNTLDEVSELSLKLFETARLRVWEADAAEQGLANDLSDDAIVWESEQPDVVRVSQGGLVQRLRNSDRPVRARVLGLDMEASFVVLPSET